MVGKVFVNNNNMSFEEKCDNLCHLHWSILLLEFGIANSMVYIVHDQEVKHLEEVAIDI